MRAVAQQQTPQTADDQIPKGYKRTEVGVIPEDWKCSRIGELAIRVGSGITPRGGERAYKPEGRPFVRSQNVGWGRLELRDLAFIDEETHDSFPSTEIQAGDVLLNITGASIGRCAVADERVVGGNVNQHVCEIRTIDSALAPKFLSALLLSDGGQRQIDSFQAGGNRQGLNFGQIRSFLIPVPRPGEQRAIATALSDADALIESLDRLIGKKRAIKQGAMQQLLTGKKRLPGFESRWQSVDLGRVAKIKTGNRNNQDKVDDGEYPFFVRSSTVERIDTYSHDGEAILIPGEGGIGSIFHYINGRCDVHQRVYKISHFSPDVAGKFVYYAMMQKFGNHAMQYTVKATVDSLRLPTFKNFTFPIPEDVDEQQAIVTVLTDMDEEIAALERRREKMAAVKKGMMHDLLTGKVRLVEPEASA